MSESTPARRLGGAFSRHVHLSKQNTRFARLGVAARAPESCAVKEPCHRPWVHSVITAWSARWSHLARTA
eukprot:8205741-Alexandrium_andersonii.AAC.1